MRKHRLTRDEKRLIRAAACREAGSGRVLVEAGCRYSLVGEGEDVNVRLISQDEHWSDTDLHDFVPWCRLCVEGFEFAPGGRALIDFYCSTLGRNGELQGNIQAPSGRKKDGSFYTTDGVHRVTITRAEFEAIKSWFDKAS
jgi:hypothetical protein